MIDKFDIITIISCHDLMLTQMLLSSDWSMGIHDITFFQAEPALFKAVIRAETKVEISLEITKA